MTFSLNEERKKAFSTVETGEYKVILEKCTLENNKEKEGFIGNRYDCIFKIIEGKNVNSTFKVLFNRKNKNEKVVAGSLNSLVVLTKVIASQNTGDNQLRMLASKIYKDQFTSMDDAFESIAGKSVLEQKPFTVFVTMKESKYTDATTGELRDGLPSYNLTLTKLVENQADEVLKKFITPKETDNKVLLDDSIPI